MPHVPIPRKELEGPDIDLGDHSARIDVVKLRTSAAGNQVMFIGWKITGNQPPAGASVPDNITLIPDAYWKLQQLFTCIGYTPGEQGFQTEDLLNAECIITVGEEPYNNVTRKKVTGYKSLAA